MKTPEPGTRRQKIILYYILAVMLPGIILGYLAYRGILNDQALREKESRKRLEMNSQAFFAAVDSSFVPFMNEHIADSTLFKSQKGDPSLLAWFVKNTSDSKKLIHYQLLYLPAELLTIQPDQVTSQANLKEGIRLEFSERRFSEALKFYQNTALKTTNPTEKILALVASARLLNKMNQPQRAKGLYDQIRKDYPESLLNGQIPLGLIASLEILKINQSLGEKDEMSINSRQSLELLLHPACEYDKNQFALFYQSFKEIIPKKDPVIDSLFAKIDAQRTGTDYLVQILLGTDLTTTDENHSGGGINEISIVPVNMTKVVTVYLSREINGLQTGMVVDFPVYIKSLSKKLVPGLDPNSSINLKIEDNNSRLVFSKVSKIETNYVSFPFPEYLPHWKLLISENKPGFLSTLLKEGSGIYLYIFILIVLLMVLGFVFIMYTLNVEIRLNKMKSEFISNVSHELKSPLTAIRMMTEMLHHNRVRTEERKSAYYSAMLEESEHLSHLIDNILDFSRIDEDRKKYEFIDLNLDELLLKFLELIRERFPEAGFDIRYSHSGRVPFIRADKDSILQVLYNLADNAMKFSGTSRQIDINLVSKDDELQLCVRDYGLGIPVKDQEKIFDRFYRCDEPQRLGIKGSGIGLTIVKKIIEAHNGHLTLESRPGEGSTFCVHLPVNKTGNLEPGPGE